MGTSPRCRAQTSWDPSADLSCCDEFQSPASTCSPGHDSPGGSAASHTSLPLLANPHLFAIQFPIHFSNCGPGLALQSGATHAPKPPWSNAAPACCQSLSILLCQEQLLSPPTLLRRELSRPSRLTHTWFPSAHSLVPLSTAALPPGSAHRCLPLNRACGTRSSSSSLSTVRPQAPATSSGCPAPSS